LRNIRALRRIRGAITHQNCSDAPNLRDHGRPGRWRPAPTVIPGARRLKLAAFPLEAIMRAEMRAELERLPANSAAHAALIRVCDASTEEVNDRARKAWAKAE
jgi:hypothetical protein